MSLSNEHIGSKILAKIKIYILTRAELLFTLCYEIPCTCAIIAFEYVLTKLLCDNKSFPYKAPLNPPEYLLIHTVTDCSNGTNADTSCCTSSNPCGEGEGDCPLLISTSFLKYSLELKKKIS